MNEPAPVPPASLGDVVESASSHVDDGGEKVSAFLSRLDGRAHGLLAIILGLTLLVPVRWLLPQVAGLLLLISGWRLFSGIPAPFLPILGGRTFKKPRFETASRTSRRWLGAVSKPRLSSFTTGFAGQAAAIALIAAGCAAFVPSTHFWLGLGLILLGLGLTQRDGLAALPGLALTFAASAFTLTLTAGTIAGAPFAGDWGRRNLPFIHAPPAPLVPDDHATR